MATFTTELDEAGEILMLIEAETTGAFSKSDNEIEANPLQAFKLASKNSAIIARSLADNLAKGMAGSGVDFEVSFAVKVDSSGGIMLGMRSDDGQFKVTVKRSGN